MSYDWDNGYTASTFSMKADIDDEWSKDFGDLGAPSQTNWTQSLRGGKVGRGGVFGSNGFKQRQNDWICASSSCAANNFSSRSECFRCNEPKGDAEVAPVNSSNGFKPRQNDWICTSSSCAVKNFGNRTECFKCHEPKGAAEDAPADYSGGFTTRQRTEWKCQDSNCGIKNFGHRTECFKCNEPKGDALDFPADSSNGSKPRQNDWTCTSTSCAAMNFGNRTECFKCNEPKGDAEDAPANFSFGSKLRQIRWICTSSNCAAKNFATRSECFKCHEPKGDAEDVSDSNEFANAAAADDKPKEIYIPKEVEDDELFNMGISSGANFVKFDDIPVNVTGDNIPAPCKSFHDAGLVQFVLENIEKGGYQIPTPVQKNAIPIILAGRDVVACAQTGSGKTGAFLVPIIHKLLTDEREVTPGSPHVLIISPTRELVTQIYYEAKKFAAGSFLKCCQIYGGTSSRHQSAVLGSGCHILVATPGRLKDFVDRTYLDFRAIRFIVLDEADRMLDMGFLSTLEEIMSHPTMVPTGKRQTLMFSATFADEIKDLSVKFLHEHLFLTIGIVGGACQDVDQTFYQVARSEKRDKLMDLLDNEDPTGTIIFVGTKRNADFLATYLSESKHAATSIHGDRLQSQREQALQDFKTNKMKILIATSVAARGLDIPNVCHVINYDLPKTIDDYVHRIGRTGRVGNQGKATSFYDSEQDPSIASDLVNILKGANQTIPDFLLNNTQVEQWDD